MLTGLWWSLVATLLAAAFLVPYRYAVDEAPRLTAMTAMFIVAALFNAAVGVRGLRRGFDGLSVRVAVVLAVFTVLGNLGIALGLQSIGAGMTSVVLKAQVVLTPIIAAWLLSERMSGRFWAGGILAFGGVALPSLLEQRTGATGGYALALMGALAFSMMQIVTRRVIDRIHAPSVNALRLVLAVAVIHALPEGRAVWSASPTMWFFAGLAGVLGPGLSRLSLMNAARHVSPSITALVALVGPIFAFALGAFFFAERPSAAELGGAALIVGGVAWPLVPPLRAALAARAARERAS